MRTLDAAPGRTGAPRPDDGVRERHGLLLVDKHAGVTSHDVVARARRALGIRSVGHLGTLDPPATGLLILMVGAATRCAAVWQRADKLYEATLRLGVTTSTQDATGDVLARRPVDCDEAKVAAASLGFLGDVMQVPPMVSAIRVGGERLHRLARRGITVERRPRPIHVATWEWLAIDLPSARFRVRCSAGTYVRTLAHDLGERLGPGAHLTSLRRLASGPFTLDKSVPGPELWKLERARLWELGGIDLAEALAPHAGVALDPPAVEAIGYGAPAAIGPDVAAALPLEAGPRSIVLRDPAGRPLALGELTRDPERPGSFCVQPHVVLPWAVRTGAPAGGPAAS